MPSSFRRSMYICVCVGRELMQIPPLCTSAGPERRKAVAGSLNSPISSEFPAVSRSFNLPSISPSRALPLPYPSLATKSVIYCCRLSSLAHNLIHGEATLLRQDSNQTRPSPLSSLSYLLHTHTTQSASTSTRRSHTHPPFVRLRRRPNLHDRPATLQDRTENIYKKAGKKTGCVVHDT